MFSRSTAVIRFTCGPFLYNTISVSRMFAGCSVLVFLSATLIGIIIMISILGCIIVRKLEFTDNDVPVD